MAPLIRKGRVSKVCLDTMYESQADRICSVHQARLQLPTWFAHKVWDFLVYKASDKWKFYVCLWHIRPYENVVFDHALYGSFSDILSVVRSGQASLHDRNPDGWTLLHVRKKTFLKFLTQNVE